MPFFKKLRKSLIPASGLKRYLLYAVGEILLVMIGILLALEVSNRSEAQKERERETRILRNFKASIADDVKTLDWHIRDFDRTNRSIEIIINRLRQNLPYHDSLAFHFANSTVLWAPAVNQEVFESLTTTDLNTLTNDTLQKALVAYYTYANRNFNVRITRYAAIMENASQQLFTTRFDVLWENTWNTTAPRRMTPLDYKALRQDKAYLYFIKSLRNQLYWYVREPLRTTRKQAAQLVAIIDREMEKRSR